MTSQPQYTNSPTATMQHSPTSTTSLGESPTSVTTGGIGSSVSSLASAQPINNSPPLVSGDHVHLSFYEGPPPVYTPSPSNRSAGESSSKAKSAPDAEPSPRSYANTTIPMKISRIFERFLVRMPHTFIAMAWTFLPLYYGLGWEGFAYSATTFVGVGGTVYCFVRALFLEIIPEWLLPRTNDTRGWRRLMNITYTGFITVIFTTAVWKLPDLSTTQGLLCLGLTFGAPYIPLSKLYPDIDKPPRWMT